MITRKKPSENEKIETLALSASNAFGSVWSVIIHTVLFIGAFIFIATGTDLNKVLLVLTTFVSLEAIYLSIFIKMSSNKQSKTLERVERDMDAIVDDVEEMKKDVEEIRVDVDETHKKEKRFDGE
jgi:peptidoglycan hydrolase CwlO-like protein